MELNKKQIRKHYRCKRCGMFLKQTFITEPQAEHPISSPLNTDTIKMLWEIYQKDTWFASSILSVMGRNK